MMTLTVSNHFLKQNHIKKKENVELIDFAFEIFLDEVNHIVDLIKVFDIMDDYSKYICLKQAKKNLEII